MMPVTSKTNDTRHDRAARISVRAYRILLRVYPAELRDEYGVEMTRCFRDLCRDELRDGGAFGLVALWARTLKELPPTATKERLAMLDRTTYRSIPAVGIVTALILLIPATASVVSDDMDWSLFDFVAAALLLFGTGSVFVLAARKARHFKQQAAIGLVLAAALVYVWLELAVGVFTTIGS